MPRGGDHRSKSGLLKKLEGDRRKVGRTKLEQQIEREPKGRGKPKLPLHLTAAERLEFQHVLDTAPAAILTGADQRLIENYCVARRRRGRRRSRWPRPASWCRAAKGRWSIPTGGSGGRRRTMPG